MENVIEDINFIKGYYILANDAHNLKNKELHSKVKLKIHILFMEFGKEFHKYVNDMILIIRNNPTRRMNFFTLKDPEVYDQEKNDWDSVEKKFDEFIQRKYQDNSNDVAFMYIYNVHQNYMEQENARSIK